MRCGSLGVLMWKHLTVRMRRFLHTPIEVVSPILLILGFFVLRKNFKQIPASELLSHEIIEVPPLFSFDAHPIDILLYTPNTKLAGDIMANVGKDLELPLLNVLPNIRNPGYYPYSNLTDIPESLKNSLFFAFITFEDLEAQDWDERKSDQFTYTIQYEGFDLKNLQWAIDRSYVKERTNRLVPKKLSFQEFPENNAFKKLTETATIINMILSVVCPLSILLLFVFLMSRLVEERATGIQELIKMVGVSSNVLGLSHFLNTLPAGLTYAVLGTIIVKASDNAMIENASGMVIFLGMALHFVTVATLAMACSFLSPNAQYTIPKAIFAYLFLCAPAWLLLAYVPSQRGLLLLTGILPHVPMNWMWGEIAAFEGYNYRLSFSDITSSHTESTGPILLGLFWMVVQSALFTFIWWYLSHVRPGKYGQSRPWNFFCQKQYWTNDDIRPSWELDEVEDAARDKKYFEDPPSNRDVGIKIENVSKYFPNHKALNNVSLEVYKGEITILLGHNGAGKTTLMSIITGMMNATEGKVYVNGVESVKHRDEVRSQLGLCPQHNLFFPDLTVLEHVLFFTMIKGGSFSEARKSSKELLLRLGIADKGSSKSSELSGGMKRRLQLACALAGGSSVLVLDEPTSGLDVETRRELWDLLLSLRGERTVLLTTHIMEEADALGDRVAALHSGQLRCHATTMHLKKAIGTGYRLTMTTFGVPSDSSITPVVTSQVADASLKEKSLKSLSYNLPASDCNNFPKLFSKLEEKRSELGIETIGVGVSTLEEVFLKLCSDTDTTFLDEEVTTDRIEPIYNKVTGFPLYLRQIIVLLKRQYKFIVSRKVSFLLMNAILPMAIIFAISLALNQGPDDNPSSFDDSIVTLDLDLYSNPQKVFYTSNLPNVSQVLEEYSNVEFTKSENILPDIMELVKHDMFEYNKHRVGIEITNDTQKVYYTKKDKYAASVGINLLSNVWASQYLPGANQRSIITRYQPIKRSKENPNQVKGDLYLKCVVWPMAVVFIILSSNINCASLPCRERVSGSRHLHVMAGCAPELHWACTLTAHLLAALPLLAATAVAAALDTSNILSNTSFIVTLLFILPLGLMAFLAFAYFISFHLSEGVTTTILATTAVICCLVTSPILTAFKLKSPPNDAFIFLLHLVNYTLPPNTLVLVVVERAFASLGTDYAPNSNLSPKTEILILTAQFLVYMTLVILTQRGLINAWSDKLFNRNIKSEVPAQEEAQYVNKEIALCHHSHYSFKDAMLVGNVHKNYFRIFGKSCHAVKGLSLSVKKGECFGLLGVNGAGKSTTFKMLTAEECATKGDIYANGHFIGKNKGQLAWVPYLIETYLRVFRTKYLRSLGYCPQFFGLDDFQTGRDNLELLLTLRGLDASDVSSEVQSWIDIVGLEKYSQRQVSGYSGGCTRRLAAAAALCSGAPLTLLDEPTAGVDVAARRRVWSALRRSLRLQRSVVITSHSMDEMEALCSRIGIMSGGVLRALGTPAELRAAHAQGHAVVIKVKNSPGPEGDVLNNCAHSITELKNILHSKFNCTLKDEHKTMLHYHINETMRYSDLFTELETIKSTYSSLVEDYSVTETTLEEVFLSFAKENYEAPI